MKLGLVVEDRKLYTFIQRVCEQICHEEAARLEYKGPWITRGCRRPLLKDMCRQAAAVSDLVCIGVDSDGMTHERKGLTFKQKRASLEKFLEEETYAPVIAVAQPSVEAWLISDPNAFSAGVAEGLGIEFRMPREWPEPRSEGDAKADLGRVVSEGTGGSLPQFGFEFAGGIVRRIDLRRVKNKSLAAMIGDIRAAVRAGKP